MQKHHPLESTKTCSEENGLQQVDTSYIHEDHGIMDLNIQNFEELLWLFFFFLSIVGLQYGISFTTAK